MGLMPNDKLEKKIKDSQRGSESKWRDIENAQNLLEEIKDTQATLIKIPDKVDLKLKSGFFFGFAVGIGFCIGFLISLMILLGSISFYVYTKFPQLFK
ncbi:hypothetical protein COS81_01655 [candidate division WWE3 bacterium CG06_land_8_20_14_3_00_42_16]|uniref:Tetrahydromethanopterin S-methyltransferase n=4 Tax=Katanobacteria TaxID=422282 RepID=A0A2M7ANT6_UNCKA|nr:MAG: hypothetical protein COS81_01655 [candidate division WWE3 bacterium CG06_land_8_20_14_3_00_42_16]PJA37548.1 MAG: hypothetical protein CO181_03145 [candidate division WWE3 bacterium CG_4_9_14_3_um_filter_43_9]